jgi:maltose alpha-D-glucosyltransferase/alpha-amylase
MVIATVEAVLGVDRVARYQLPLAWVDDDSTEARDARAVLARVPAGGRGLIIDATEDPAFRAGLADALVRGAVIDADGARWIAEAVGDGAGDLAGLPSRVGSAEQSNTSIVIGDVAMLKLYRKLEVGENPDVEIGRFLATHADFAGTPALLGTARIEDRSGSSVAAILQRFVPDATDAWAFALESARHYLALPEDDTRTPAFVDEERQLARVTRRLHEALASDTSDPDFAPRAVTAADVARWAEAAKRSVGDGLALLRERVDQAALSGEAAGAARAVLHRRAEFPGLVDEIEAAVRGDGGMRIRHHGDYHLGQVLRTRDGGFMIIDFEGEPARPLAERRARHSALRDVAGMLRSFAYVSATAAIDMRSKGSHAVVEIRSGRWLRDVRQAFVHAYLSDGDRGEPAILPHDRASVARLVALFEIEKVFYELRYELNNRPDWVWIPLRGIARLTESGAVPA